MNERNRTTIEKKMPLILSACPAITPESDVHHGWDPELALEISQFEVAGQASEDSCADRHRIGRAKDRVACGLCGRGARAMVGP